jgi:BA14K-like protein
MQRGGIVGSCRLIAWKMRAVSLVTEHYAPRRVSVCSTRINPVKNSTKILSAASLAIAMSFTSLTTAFALPLPLPKVPLAVSQLEEVQYRGDNRDLRRYRSGYYNGQRGYRDRRPGYRRYSDGFWYPLAAFGTAAIIGGAIANQPRADYGGSRHVQWCANRYQSYRASDNTYVPRAGVRASCNSPYS